MAILNTNISHTTIDGALFKEEVRDRQIMNVPAIYLNGEWFGSGRFSLEQILQKLGESNSSMQVDNHEPYDVLVIGGGPAGATAALYAARQGMRTGIVAERFGGHVVDSISVEQMVGIKEGDRSRLVANLEEFVFDYGVDVWNLQRAKKLHLRSLPHQAGQSQKIQVTLENDTTLQCKTVIIATGTSRQNLNIPGEMEFKNKGVSHCAECVGPLYENKHVAIIGGGQSGLEAAQYLSSVARHVTVLELQPALTASEPLQKKVRQLANVTLLCNVQVQEINGKHTVERLKYLETSSNTSRELQIDGLIVHIGRVPNTQWLDARIQRNHLGEIMVDPYGATNIPGVYATGDCTDQPYKQLIISLGNGATTALHAVQFLQNNENEPA
jgi:alkyl hydroperoxide reductase subunit F